MKLNFSISHIERSIELNFSKKIHIIVNHKNINVNTVALIGNIQSDTICRNINNQSNRIKFESLTSIQTDKPLVRLSTVRRLIFLLRAFKQQQSPTEFSLIIK